MVTSLKLGKSQMQLTDNESRRYLFEQPVYLLWFHFRTFKPNNRFLLSHRAGILLRLLQLLQSPSDCYLYEQLLQPASDEVRHEWLLVYFNDTTTQFSSFCAAANLVSVLVSSPVCFSSFFSLRIWKATIIYLRWPACLLVCFPVDGSSGRHDWDKRRSGIPWLL